MRIDAEYCRPQHRRAAAERRRRQRIAAENGKTYGLPKLSENAHKLQGREEIKKEVRESGLWAAYLDGRMQQVEIAQLLAVSQSQIKRAFDELRNEDLAYKADETWIMDDDVMWMLGLDLEMPDLLDDKACSVWASELTDRFLAFERTFFKLPTGDEWIRETFHRKWTYEFLFAYATGGYLQIMSPPRHGKSELVTHFIIWLICRNHNIRIMYVGPNDEIIEERIGVMKELLEDPALVDKVLPPSQNFAPLKRGAGTVWTALKFKVDCRARGITGNTVSGLGRGKKMLSMNADLIIMDDIEDHLSTKSGDGRAETRAWFQTQMDSRKEEHTPCIVIGSRQHADDLYGYNLDDGQFRNIVNSAHDPECRLDPDDYGLHIDCMLFPRLRTYRFLMSKKHGAEARDSAATYEMVWLNAPQEEGYQIFPKDLVESAYNHWRPMGDLTKISGEGKRLIAGLDPSATGFQAGVLWCLTYEQVEREIEIGPGMGTTLSREFVVTRHLLDMENRKGGGIENAMELMMEWKNRYGLQQWVIESDGFNAGFSNNRRFKEWLKATEIHVEPHQTKDLKYDRNYGVGADARLFRDGLIDLPYGDPRGRSLVQIYQRQLTAFTDDPIKNRRGKSDVLMAAWFPSKAIRRYEKELQARNSEVKSIDSAYPVSYPGISGFTTHNTAPWSGGR
jgi:hypothetical protein